MLYKIFDWVGTMLIALVVILVMAKSIARFEHRVDVHRHFTQSHVIVWIEGSR